MFKLRNSIGNPVWKLFKKEVSTVKLPKNTAPHSQFCYWERCSAIKTDIASQQQVSKKFMLLGSHHEYHTSIITKAYNSNTATTTSNDPLKNSQIRYNKVLFINGSGENKGMISINEAMESIDQTTHDLVLVKDNPTNPVCRAVLKPILQLRTKPKKDTKDIMLKRHHSVMKELQFSCNISEHDVLTKLNRVEVWSEKEYQIQLIFKKKSRESMDDLVPTFNLVESKLSDMGLIVAAKKSIPNREIWVVKRK